VVKALLEAYPEGAEVAERKSGWLPLRQALRNSTSAGEGTVVEMLLDVYPQGAELKDQFDHLPLHLAARKNAGEAAVSAPLRAYRDGAIVPDKEGKLSLHLAAGHKT
jgi:hypothetical protein